jgi:hypothetical protein
LEIAMKRKPWFGERMLVPGFPRPITWQGRLVALALILVVLADAVFIGVRTAPGIVVLIGAVIAYAVIAKLTGGNGWSWGAFRRHPKP